MHFITGYSIPDSHFFGGPKFGNGIATFMADGLKIGAEKREKCAATVISYKRAKCTKIAINRVKKIVVSKMKEHMFVLEAIILAIFPPIHSFNEGGERFIYTAAVF